MCKSALLSFFTFCTLFFTIWTNITTKSPEKLTKWSGKGPGPMVRNPKFLCGPTDCNPSMHCNEAYTIFQKKIRGKGGGASPRTEGVGVKYQATGGNIKGRKLEAIIILSVLSAPIQRSSHWSNLKSDQHEFDSNALPCIHKLCCLQNLWVEFEMSKIQKLLKKTTTTISKHNIEICAYFLSTRFDCSEDQCTSTCPPTNDQVTSRAS